eukprot:TRINITY_DN521_c0_g1_i1.p1 TRINITY_DN521_c0_g1~~TRINITY_DN521_c0_g1_i1.p1  ORF type:complete len:185 (-),score=11.40 TRINITY_DN521_c0_g1_i1:52-606(-)
MNFLRSLFFRAAPAAAPGATASLAKNRLASVIADQRALARMEEEAISLRATSSPSMPSATFSSPSHTSTRLHEVPSTVAPPKQPTSQTQTQTQTASRTHGGTVSTGRPPLQYTIASSDDGNQLESIFGLGPKIKSKLQAERVMTVSDLAQLSDSKCESLKREQSMTTIFLLRSRAQERLKELKR